MTPTLSGRLQTRVALLALIGGVWTLLHTPLLPTPTPVSAADRYQVTFTALLVVAAVGLVWELLYHLAQQLRWEKDWPTLLGLVTGLPEGLVVYWLLARGVPWSVGEVPPLTFALSFASTWLVVWAFANGPLRIVLVRWRFRGGRFR
ncbi:MAG: hypothetical protein AAGK32_19300 [Actinomycetota bacterium]